MKNNRKLLYKLVQLICFVLLGLLMLNIFALVNIIQGTGRVINYTGIIRGGTQRLVKLELAGYPKDDLVAYLDEILSNLQNGGGRYELAKLNNPDYLNQLAVLNETWGKLKSKIISCRLDPGSKETVLETSEVYFKMANDVVGTAELYSDKNAAKLNVYETVLGVLLIFLILISLQQTFAEIHLTRKNKELKTFAYIDKMTGLPGRRSCEEKTWIPMDLMNLAIAPLCLI